MDDGVLRAQNRKAAVVGYVVDAEVLHLQLAGVDVGAAHVGLVGHRRRQRARAGLHQLQVAGKRYAVVDDVHPRVHIDFQHARIAGGRIGDRALTAKVRDFQRMSRKVNRHAGCDSNLALVAPVLVLGERGIGVHRDVGHCGERRKCRDHPGDHVRVRFRGA